MNLTAVQVIKTWILSLFAKKSELNALSARVDDIVAEGGEPNVIETVKVNGTALTPDANKAVDVTVPEKVSDITNDSGYQTSTQVGTAITTALANNGNAYQTESEVDAKIGSAIVGALKPKGSIAFANLPALTAANLNNEYNITDSFTTTADFVEGAGHSHSAGSNVAIVNVGDDANPVYKYDVMVGLTDLSAYWTSTTGQNNTLEAATTTEINNILNAE